MGLFSKSRKTPSPYEPYADQSINQLYNMLFCDRPDLFSNNLEKPYPYPYSVLFADMVTAAELQAIIDDPATEPRLKLLACNRQIFIGHKPDRKELLGVVVEVALEEGLDVLASFADGTARYINYTGRVLVWETTTDAGSNAITEQLFANSIDIINRIGPTDQPRLPFPVKGNARISFLVSDGLYFGEAPINYLFSYPMAGPALQSATSLMQYLTEYSTGNNKAG